MSELPLRFRVMGEGDVDSVMELERNASPSPWTERMLRQELSVDVSTVLLCEQHENLQWRLKAYAVYWLVAREQHILNVATAIDARRQGFGRRLLSEALSRGRSEGVDLVTLEVRRGNLAAQALYLSLGFRSVGVRPGYYQDNREDAVIMNLQPVDAGLA